MTYRMEVQNILRKMATGIKVLYSIRNILPEKTRLLLLNSPVLGHLYYSSILINGISQNLRLTRETIKLGCESLLSQEELRFIERSQVTIQNFTCGSHFGFESCSLFLEISK